MLCWDKLSRPKLHYNTLTFALTLVATRSARAIAITVGMAIVYLKERPMELSQERQAGATDETEVTSEMVDAGTKALWENTTLVEFSNPADRLGVRIILEAALRAQSRG